MIPILNTPYFLIFSNINNEYKLIFAEDYFSVSATLWNGNPFGIFTRNLYEANFHTAHAEKIEKQGEKSRQIFHHIWRG